MTTRLEAINSFKKEVLKLETKNHVADLISDRRIKEVRQLVCKVAQQLVYKPVGTYFDAHDKLIMSIDEIMTDHLYETVFLIYCTGYSNSAMIDDVEAFAELLDEAGDEYTCEIAARIREGKNISDLTLEELLAM